MPSRISPRRPRRSAASAGSTGRRASSSPPSPHSLNRASGARAPFVAVGARETRRLAEAPAPSSSSTATACPRATSRIRRRPVTDGAHVTSAVEPAAKPVFPAADEMLAEDLLVTLVGTGKARDLFARHGLTELSLCSEDELVAGGLSAPSARRLSA